MSIGPPLRLTELVRHSLKAVRATLLREVFEPFWTYRSVDWAGAFPDERCVQVMRSKIESMKRVVRMLRRHRPLLAELASRARADFRGVRRGLNNRRN